MQNTEARDINKTEEINVALNSKVTYKDHERGDIFKVQLVFPAFADPAKDLFSIRSPLGIALIGKKTGDIVTCHTPQGERTLELLDVAHSVLGEM